MLGSALVAAAILLWSSAGFAEDMEALKRQAGAEFAREVTTCSAYFLIRMEFLRNGGRNNYILMTELMADKMLQRAEQLMPAEKAQADIRAEGLRMLKEIGNDIRNVGELNEKYGATCHTVYAEPESRLAWWVETIRAGGNTGEQAGGMKRQGTGRRYDSP
jgi:hypothetical protein